MLNKIELIGCYRSENPDFVVMIMEGKGDKTIVEYTVDGITEEWDISLGDLVSKGIDIELWEWYSENKNCNKLIELNTEIWDELYEGINFKDVDSVWS